MSRFFIHSLFAMSAALLVATTGAPEARAEDDALAGFSDPDASAEELRAALNEARSSLSKGAGVSTAGPASVRSAGEKAERQAQAAELQALLVKSADALRSAGWGLPETIPAVLVVRVRVHGAVPLTVTSDDGRIVLVRESDGARTVEPPAPPVRPDGVPVLRDLVVAGNRARIWAASLAASRAPTPATEIAARHVVRWAVPQKTVPPWLREGLVAWVQSKTAPDAAPHCCRPWAAPLPATLVQKLTPSASVPGGARPWLARFLGVLFEGKPDASKRFFVLAESTAPLDQGVQKAYGVALADAATAARIEIPAGAAATCDEQGGVPCPACAGAGKVEVACTECRGSGGVCCPSCSGSDSCINCTDGYLYYAGGKKVKCRLCTGGKTKCMACNNQLRTACRSCTGTGKVVRACLACDAGRFPCPDGGGAAPGDARPCPWCADTKIQDACSGCSGAGFLGCPACLGTLRVMCDDCGATGETRMVYKDGTTASSTKCGACGGKGFSRCEECKNGKLPCAKCGGKGRGERDVSECPACKGARTLPEPDPALLRPRSSPLTKQESEDQKAAIEKAVKFLLTCRSGDGAFTLRKLRRGKTDVVGALDEASQFANAMTLWTLSTYGRGKDDPALTKAWEALRAGGDAIVKGTDPDMGVQAASLTLRALMGAKEDPKSPLVKGLIERIAKGQHADGLWINTLVDTKGEGEVFDSLFAAESLRLARINGARVPSGVWGKLFRGASSHLDSKTFSNKNDFLTGTHVASAIALVVIAKEGTLGTKAVGFDYAGIPQVKKGMAWLDRYFDIKAEPQFSRGAPFPSRGDAGYMAWLFSIQRLGVLLDLETLGGERWYPAGARHVLSTMYPDGSFEERSRYALNGPVRTTTGAILFLLRATPPITNSQSDDE